jgi:hypothetical protein
VATHLPIQPAYRTHRDLADAVVEVLNVGRHAILGSKNPDGSVPMVPSGDFAANSAWLTCTAMAHQTHPLRRAPAP